MQFVRDNVWLILAALVSGGMLLWPAVKRLFSGVGEIDVPEAVQLINHRDAVVLDVREESEYAAGHIPNSKHIPLGDIGERMRELEKFKQKPVVVLCRSGTNSASACGLLRKHGFIDVRALQGGIQAWQQASLPVRKK